MAEEMSIFFAYGAEAFGLHIDIIEPQYRTKKDFTELFQAMDGRSAYITDYSRGNVNPVPQGEEELTQELLMAFDCGAKLCDIRGDLYCPSAGELQRMKLLWRSRKH